MKKMSYKIMLTLTTLMLSFSSYGYTCKAQPRSKKECDSIVANLQYNINIIPKVSEAESNTDVFDTRSFSERRGVGVERSVLITCGCIDKNDQYLKLTLEYLLVKAKSAQTKYDNIVSRLEYALFVLNVRYDELIEEKVKTNNKQVFIKKIKHLLTMIAYARREIRNFDASMVGCAHLIKKVIKFSEYTDSLTMNQILQKHGFKNEEWLMEYSDFLSSFMIAPESKIRTSDITRYYDEEIRELINKIKKLN